jgi:16S rRNA (cytosine967-C5)-methyltransferase
MAARRATRLERHVGERPVKASAARRVAREVVSRVRERNAFAHELMDSALRSASLTPEDAAFATKLAYGTLQSQGTLLESLGRYTHGRRVEPRILDALCVSAYEILFLRTEPRAAVHQGVELVRELRQQAAGLANAVLRRLSEDAPTFPWGDVDRDLSALARAYAHPVWLAQMWVDELGRDVAARVMESDNEPAPLYLAVNSFAGSVADAMAALEADGARPEPGPLPCMLVARDAAAAVHGRALQAGLVIAVDGGAQLVASLVTPRAGECVVEVGAGRGTKTLLLQADAVRAGGGPANLRAIDSHEFKAQLLKDRLRRYNVPGVEVLVGDAADPAGVPGLPADGTVDRVLVDAPCSGLGTLRRHPEKRWRVTRADVDALGALGSRLLERAALLVRRGGFVVYSTCTVAVEEHERVVREFLDGEVGSAFLIDPVGADVPEVWAHFVTDEGFFRSVPTLGGPDGHFAARLVRV